MHAEGSTSRWLDDLAVDDDGRTPPPRRRSRLLIAGATVPWLVVAAVLVLPELSGGAADPDPAGTIEAATPDDGAGDHPEEPAAGEPAPVDDDGGHAQQQEPPEPDEHDTPGAHGAGDGEPLELLELRGDWRVEAGVEEAAALAVVVARAWLTGLDPALPIDGLRTPADGRYAEHLVVEAVEQPVSELTVVTVLAVVLDNADALAAEVHRLAVPVTWLDGQPRPGGSPWPLPAPDLTPHELPVGEVTEADSHEAAERALLAAGYTDVRIRSLHVTGSGAVLADVEADTPGGDRTDGGVWLRHHVDGYVVAGTTLTGGSSS